MGLDDLGKLAVSNYKKWFMSINDKYDTYINDAMESMGDPFKYNNVSNSSRKSSINRLTDFLNDIQEYKENSIKRINSVFEKAQKADGDIIDEIRPIYQQALDKINTNIENVSIYEQQLIGLKNVEKYKEGTKAFNKGFDNVRGEDLARQELEIEKIWDRDKDTQQKLYDDINKNYTQTYHPEINNRKYYYSERNSSFLNDNVLKRYEELKQTAPGIIITEQSYDWETDIDKAHESALRENKRFDRERQSEGTTRRRVNNNTTTQNQVNNNSTTAQSQVNTAQKKRRKSYADRKTKPINSELNTTFYGQYNPQTRDYEYVDYKSHYSGGVSRSVYDSEWMDEKIFGEAHSNSEYGIEAPWSTNRTRNTNASDAPSTSDAPDASNAPEVNANTTNTSTSSAPPDQSAGPKQGDAFWDNKNKRQLVYDGPDSVHGNYNFYTREGTVVNSSMDNLSPYKGKVRLDYDMLKNYNTELNRFEQLTSPYFNLKYDDPETFYTDLTKNINKIDEYEKIIGSKYRSFKGNKSYHKTRAYMSDEINKYFGSEIIVEDPFNKKKNNTSTNTNSTNTSTNTNSTDTSTNTNSTDTSTKETVETTTQDPRPDQQNQQSQQQRTINMNDPSSWTDEDIKNIADGDPEYAQELINQRNAARNQSQQQQQQQQQQQADGFNIPDGYSDDPITWTDEDIKDMANGDQNIYNELKKRRDNAFANEAIDDALDAADDAVDAARGADDVVDDVAKFGKLDMVMSAVNVLGTVGDYKAERRKGRGVVASAVTAGAKFAAFEALGVWALPVQLVSALPGMAIKGADMLYKENRRMNSSANFQTFGDAQFMDTQQLATMRQSGMEMAKMAQYNLQQTLMGNEATYLHR